MEFGQHTELHGLEVHLAIRQGSKVGENTGDLGGLFGKEFSDEHVSARGDTQDLDIKV